MAASTATWQVLGQQVLCGAAGLVQQVRVFAQIGKAQQIGARLARAQQLAWAADFQIEPGNLKPVGGVGHGLEALFAGG